MVGDVSTLSLSMAPCFASGLSDFPEEEGGVFSTVETVESRKGLPRPKWAKLHVSEESSAEFSPRGVSSEVSSAESSVPVVSM